MNKRKVLETHQQASRCSVENKPSRSLGATAIHFAPDVRIDNANAQQQVFSSEEQALEFLLSGIVEKMGGASEERSEMADFLGMLLDTDPELKAEVLAGVSIRPK